MKIKSILTEHRADFTAIMQCEHCGSEEKNNTGYHDHFYHTRVIPAMHCMACGLNRDGEYLAGGGTPFVKA